MSIKRDCKYFITIDYIIVIMNKQKLSLNSLPEPPFKPKTTHRPLAGNNRFKNKTQRQAQYEKQNNTSNYIDDYYTKSFLSSYFNI